MASKPPVPPKGNKYALGCTTSGRPRSVSLTPEQMIALGEEMIKWVEENNPLHLSYWYAIEKMILDDEWKNYIKMPEFRPYYNKAIKIVSKNYINGTINSSIAHRFINIYFKDVKEEEKEAISFKLEKEYDLKKKILELEMKLKSITDAGVAEEIKDQYKALMNQFSALQKDKKS